MFSYNPFAKPAPPPFRVGDIVYFTTVSHHGRIGRVDEVFPHWRSLFSKVQFLHHVRYYDMGTGLPMVCPDSRCKGEHTCPVHGANVWSEDIKLMSENDLAFYRKEGMVR